MPQVSKELVRLRSELNAAYAAKAEKMMDVAMEASVTALAQEAEYQRRALVEQTVLCDELRSCERRLDWAERLTLEPAAEDYSTREATLSMSSVLLS